MSVATFLFPAVDFCSGLADQLYIWVNPLTYQIRNGGFPRQLRSSLPIGILVISYHTRIVVVGYPILHNQPITGRIVVNIQSKSPPFTTRNYQSSA